MRSKALLLALGLLAPSEALAACAGESILPSIERERPEIWKAALADLEATPNATGLFWIIEKEGTPPSWLFGTMHPPDPEIGALKPVIAEAFAQSDLLVLEVADLSEAGVVSLAEKLLPLARLAEGKSFDAAFTAEQKAALGDLTAAVGMPYFMARRMQPWFLAVSLSMPPCVQAAMLRGEQGIDGSLEGKAHEAGKPIVGLETIDEQVEALASMEKAVDPGALLEIVALGPEGIADLYATLIQLYVQERPWLHVPLTLKMPEFAESAATFRLIEGTLIHDRNLRMHERLLPHLEDGGAFVAVGALHLPGDDGLVELLRASGYSVTRIQ